MLKIEENIARDIRVDRQLRENDWIPIHFWSKDVLKDVEACVSEVLSAIIENEYEERPQDICDVE